MLVRPFLVLFFLCLPLLGWADVHLVLWQSEPRAPRVILPRLDEETADQAVGRYLQALQNHPGLISLRPPDFHPLAGHASDLQPEEFAGKVRLGLIANWFQDLTAQGARIQRNLRVFSKAGADPYVVGLSADLGLSAEDAADFRNKVAENFSLLVSLGGDDISPSVYGEDITFARNTNPIRDHSELELVKAFKKKARGVFFGICRGHQMGAVADGHSLKQDLTLTGVGSTERHINLSGNHSGGMQTWHHIVFEDSLLARFLLGKTKPNPKITYMARVNSVHHQVVDPRDSAASQVIALDAVDATVEALQGKNLKSFSVQFHPEFPTEVSGDAAFSSDGFEILRGIVSYSRLVRTKNRVGFCAQVHGQ